MRFKPLVLDSGKVTQLALGNRLNYDAFSFLSVDVGATIPAKQVMKTNYLEIEAGGSLDIIGAVEIV